MPEWVLLCTPPQLAMLEEGAWQVLKRRECCPCTAALLAAITCVVYIPRVRSADAEAGAGGSVIDIFLQTAAGSS